jgi:Flp pilus assembly protein TadD
MTESLYPPLIGGAVFLFPLLGRIFLPGRWANPLRPDIPSGCMRPFMGRMAASLGVLFFCGCGAPPSVALPREPKGAVALVSVSVDTETEDAEKTVASPDFGPSLTPDSSSVPSCRLDAPLPAEVRAEASVKALHQLGQKKILEKERQTAVTVLQKANAMAPKNPQIKADYATALLQCGLVNEGVEALEAAALLAPDNADIAANLAQGYQIAGRFRAARVVYEKAAELAPDDSAILNNLAVVLVALGDVNAAETAIRRAIALRPGETSYLVDLGYILVRQKRLQDAEIVLERAVNADRNSADAYNMLGFVYFQLNYRERARENFERALTLNPNHRAARENLDALTGEFHQELE